MELTRKVTFNFKRMLKDKVEKLFDGLTPEQMKEQFDTIEEDGKVYLKRKPVTAEITLPAWVATLPEEDREIAANILEKELGNFVKGQYVDRFEDVGQHDLQFYKQEVSRRAIRTSNFSFTDEDFDKAVESFTDYISKAISNKDVGNRVGKAAERNFARSVFSQNIGEVNETNVGKLLNRLTHWAAYMNEHEEPTDGMIAVFYLWEEKLNKLMQAETVLAADLL